MTNEKDLSIYIRQFAKLRRGQSSVWTSDTQFQAPHKPFLLLTILDLFAQGRIQSNLIEISTEMGEIFAGYWSIVIPHRRGNIALPFFHMRSSPFWHLIPNPGQEQALKSARQIDTLNQLNELILGTQLDEPLFALLQSEANRNALRRVLLETFFDARFHHDLLVHSEANFQAYTYSRYLIEQARKELHDSSNPVDDYQPAVRDQGFRKAIVRIYDHRCALCGVRMMTVEGRTVIDAAHIVPWSISHDDDVHNGVALCRLCHWVFDTGLSSISTTYDVMLAGDLRNSPNLPGHLLTMEGRTILGPIDRGLWPGKASLVWHHKNVFRRR